MDIAQYLSSDAYQQMEMCVLGKIVGYQSNRILDDAIRMGLLSEMLINPIAQDVYQCLQSMAEREIVPDYIYLTKEIDALHKYDKKAVTGYLTSCLSLAEQTADYAGYVSSMIEGYANRCAVDTLNELLVNHADMNTIVNTVANLGQTFESKLKGIGATNPEDDYQRFIASYRNARESGGAVLPTGITGFDEMLGGGLPVGAMTVICARTGEGKSALMLNIATRLAQKYIPVLYITVEMTREAIWARRCATLSNMKYSSFSTKAQSLTDEENVVVEKVADSLRDKPFYMNPNEVVTVSDIYRQAMSIDGLRAIFVDYLQIIKPESGGMDEVVGISNVSHALRSLAIRLNIPLVTAAQFNRGVGGKDIDGNPVRPTMRNLKGSSAIEQDAHAVIIASRDDYDNTDNAVARTNKMRCVVHKNRTGIQYAECVLDCKMGTNSFWDSENGQSQWDLVEFSTLSDMEKQKVEQDDMRSRATYSQSYYAPPKNKYNEDLPF